MKVTVASKTYENKKIKKKERKILNRINYFDLGRQKKGLLPELTSKNNLK